MVPSAKNHIHQQHSAGQRRLIGSAQTALREYVTLAIGNVGEKSNTQLPKGKAPPQYHPILAPCLLSLALPLSFTCACAMCGLSRSCSAQPLRLLCYGGTVNEKVNVSYLDIAWQTVCYSPCLPNYTTKILTRPQEEPEPSSTVCLMLTKQNQ